MDSEGKPLEVVVLNPSDLQRKTFLTNPDPNHGGTVKRICIVEAINELKAKRNSDPALLEFQVYHEAENGEDIMSYNEILLYIECDEHEDDGTYWQFRQILGYQYTPQGHKDRKGSDWNLKIECETGEITYKSLKVFVLYCVSVMPPGSRLPNPQCVWYATIYTNFTPRIEPACLPSSTLPYNSGRGGPHKGGLNSCADKRTCLPHKWQVYRRGVPSRGSQLAGQLN